MSTTIIREERFSRTDAQPPSWGSKFELAIQDAGVSCSMLSCDFQNGHLTIHGVTKSYFDKQIAQEAVRQLPGVSRVRNELSVRGL